MRYILEEARVHHAIREKVSSNHRDLIEEVAAAVSDHPVVVVGMAGNPFCRRARRMLDDCSVAYVYLEYGGYLSRWRRRNTLKMWTGWPTFPMVFVRGQLIGGAEDLCVLLASGEFEQLLARSTD
ncbi:MAG: glutaredoxin [Gammaproteobacteria bacterium]|nr:glutaredoxin [Gammaproteobacteria bacterium]